MASHNKKMLDAIEARLEDRILSDVEAYQIGGSITRSVTKIPFLELEKARATYQAKVNQEEDQERVATGKTSKRMIKVKF